MTETNEEKKIDYTEVFDLNRHTARLLMNEPFFAALSRRIDKRAFKGIPTAGVRVNPNSTQFEMIYNPDFFLGLTEEQRLGILKHEFYHLVFEHVTGRLPEEGMTKMWNVATDLAINTHIAKELPDGALVPGREDTPFAEYPTGLSAEQYFAMVQQDPQFQKPENGEGGDGQGGEGGEGQGGEGQEFHGDDATMQDGAVGDHSGWKEMDNTEKEIAKQRLKEIVKNAAEEASRAGSWGSVPAQCKKEIIDSLTTKVDWRKVLRYFVKTSQKSNKFGTMKKINRRYAYIHPGKRTRRQAHIAISIDQSGSVSDSMLAAFFGELNKLAEIAEFTVIPFDTEVAEDFVYKWKKGERRNHERVRYGGTCFDAPTKYVNDRDFDGHIVLTDMCAPKPIRSTCQRMWMTTEYYARNPYFATSERVIGIDEND